MVAGSSVQANGGPARSGTIILERKLRDGIPPRMATEPPDPAMTLTPTQQEAVDEVIRLAAPGTVVVLQCEPGQGRTTILHALWSRLGGCLLSAPDFVRAQLDNDPFKFEETVFGLLQETIRERDAVLVDDFDLVLETLNQRLSHRRFYVNLVLRALAMEVIASRKLLVLVDNYEVPWNTKAWCHVVDVSELSAEDREFLFRRLLPTEANEPIDYDRVFRMAQHLDCRQIALACNALRHAGAVSTESLLEWVQRFRHDSNAELDSVEHLRFEELIGLESVIDAIRIHLLTPLRDSGLAQEWKLRPKRGILLHGPPGTGKTSVGRALAHELNARFFLIDGDSADEDSFMGKVRGVFRMARDNAPSVVFIDDADVLLQGAELGSNSDFYRYLLDHLDGVNTDKNSDICVVMTAMEISALPRPLLRSGRIELWLEVRLPDDAARLQLLRHAGEDLWERFGECELDPIVEITRGFSGSDMKRLLEDTKNIVADYMLQHESAPDVPTVMAQAVSAIRKSRARYNYGLSGRPAGFRQGRE